jgi:signal transduction histidine kinase
MAPSSQVCHVAGSNGECWLRQADLHSEITPKIAWSLFRECLACDTLQDYVSRADGRRTADRVLGQALAGMLDQLHHYDSQLRHTGDSLRRRVAELTILNEVSDALARAPNLEGTLQLFLIGVTAGSAIGLNRALLFLVEGPVLVGTLGLGHLTAEEGRRTWLKLAETGSHLQQLIDRVFDGKFQSDPKLNARLQKIRLDRDGTSALARVLKDREACRIDPRRAVLGCTFLDELYHSISPVAVPLCVEDEEVGVLLADNFLTGLPILEETVALLQTLANQAAAAIVNRRLHADLERQLSETEHLYELLRENQHYLMQHDRLVDMGKLATTVAHEIKTPLVAIGGFARRALKAVEQPGHRPQRELEIIIREVERLEHITAQVLDYSKEIHLDLEPIDLLSILEEAIEVVEARLAQAQIEIERIYAEGTCNVMADARRMKQVVLNLLENSIEAMSASEGNAGKGGRLRLNARSSGDTVILELEDTGPGIPEDLSDRVFTPFFTTKSAGSGLGLPVSRRIVHDHGGQILLSARGPRGARFRIELPRLKMPHAASRE